MRTPRLPSDAEVHRGARARAEDDVGGSRVRPSQRVRAVGADDDVRPPVAVDVARARDRPAGPVAGRRAVDPEAAATEGREVDLHRRGLAEDHVGGTRVLAPVVVGARRADDDVAEAVTVDVTGGGDRVAGLVPAERPPITMFACEARSTLPRCWGSVSDRASAPAATSATRARGTSARTLRVPSRAAGRVGSASSTASGSGRRPPCRPACPPVGSRRERAAGLSAPTEPRVPRHDDANSEFGARAGDSIDNAYE